MNISCMFGRHQWDGCMCARCGAKRDCEHKYTRFEASRNNECVGTCKCGKKQILDHDWDGCTCRRCGKNRNEGHQWDGEKCIRCGFPWRDSYEYARLCMDEENYIDAYNSFCRVEKSRFKRLCSREKEQCFNLAYEQIIRMISDNDYAHFDYQRYISSGFFQMEADRKVVGKKDYPYTAEIKRQIMSAIESSIQKKDYPGVLGWLKSMGSHWSNVYQSIDRDTLNDGFYGAAMVCMDESNYVDALKWLEQLPEGYPGKSEKTGECKEKWEKDPRNPDFCPKDENGIHMWKKVPGSEKKVIDHVRNPVYYTERCAFCGKEVRREFIDEDAIREAYKYNY